MSAKFKVTNSLTCEHIVESADKKHTLINTYAGNILLTEIPGRIFIAFYIEFISNVEQEIDAEIALYLGRKAAMKGETKLKFDGVNPLVLTLPSGVLQVKKPVTLKLIITPTGEKPSKLIEKKLMLIGA